MKPDTKRKSHNRARRIAGQIEGIRRMIENDRYCVEILLQIAAARAALDQLGKHILAAHIETCVADAFARRKRGEREAKMRELMEVFSRLGYVSAR